MSEQRAVGVARRLVMTLLGLDVQEVVLAPGSRSGPLALAFHAAETQGLLRLHVRVDEREAAFLALGLAKASKKVVPVVTTSGTAAAHVYPALLEARHSGITVLAITADRPGYLRGTGANQTTDQRRLFPHVPYADRVNALAESDVLKGPVHLNLEFDEPLIEPVDWDFSLSSAVTFFDAEVMSTPLDAEPRTIVIAGDGAGPRAREIAEQGGWPLLAEPSSGARVGNNAIKAYVPVLTQSDLGAQVRRVVSLGHATLSRPVTALLGRTDLDVFHIGGPGTFPHQAGANVEFCADVKVADSDGSDWLTSWQRAGSAVHAALPEAEPLVVARTVWQATGSDDLLFIGSSNPIRDIDVVAVPDRVDRQVLANRGLSGIDGLVSSAIGAALAQPRGRSIAYLGDLTFLHGSNGLLIGPHEVRPQLSIVIASDDGGSIFGSLEQGAPDYSDAFERVFATPTGATISDLCAGYGVPHRMVDPSRLADALREPSTGIEVLEVPLRRDNRRELTAEIQSASRLALSNDLPG